MPGGVAPEQCQLMAKWLESAEAMALWKLLRAEARDGQGCSYQRPVSVGAASLWIGDTSCMCYPMGTEENAGPKSKLGVQKLDLVCSWRIRDEIKEGRCVSDRYTGIVAGGDVPTTTDFHPE